MESWPAGFALCGDFRGVAAKTAMADQHCFVNKRIQTLAYGKRLIHTQIAKQALGAAAG